MTPRPYLNQMVEVQFIRGLRTIAYKTSFHGAVNVISFLKVNCQKMGIAKPASKQQSRVIYEDRKQTIPTKLDQTMSLNVPVSQSQDANAEEDQTGITEDTERNQPREEAEIGEINWTDFEESLEEIKLEKARTDNETNNNIRVPGSYVYGQWDLETASRTKKVTKLYYALNKMDNKVKLQVYNTITVPTLLYASESWITQTKHESTITAAEMKYVRKIAEKIIKITMVQAYYKDDKQQTSKESYRSKE
ncbi:hypothetical protein ILUMI_00191 [Ignelater luminosus]|uniref:Uncharacterized protein n=1 Tax=Ignelater luminosus TaxID=2038154 RepID=A0A8K0GQG9_IGNLU|nr:hypothetical protein ILUMI_00191 [Ignelater luminosus]